MLQYEKEMFTMDTIFRAERPASDVFADINRISAPNIIAIRRDQMPEDVRSAFLPGDIILLREPNLKSLYAKRTQVQAHGEVSRPNLNCLWCRADNVCAKLVMVLTASVWLGAASIQDEGTFAFHVFKLAMLQLLVSFSLLALVLVYMKCGTEACDSVDLHCAKDVKLHAIYSLTRRTLGSSSLLLLQQPMVNLRSFSRYYRFFSKRMAGGLSDEEVDICIRRLADQQSALSLAELIGDGSHALLGLEPCQAMFTVCRWGLSWLNVLYQSYRDWRRWRLATLACERLQERKDMVSQQSWRDGRNPLDDLGGLGGRGGHKWLLVDPSRSCSHQVCRRNREWPKPYQLGRIVIHSYSVLICLFRSGGVLPR